MAVNFSVHGAMLARDGGGSMAPAVGIPSTIGSVADAAASSALTDSGWVRIVATSDSLVKFGPSVANGASGEFFPAGYVEFRWLPKGAKIGVSAP